MIRAAAKNHGDVAVIVEPEDYAVISPNSNSTKARRRSRCARNLPPKPMRAPRPTMPRSPTGLRERSATTRRPIVPSAASSPRRCAMAKTRTRTRRSIARRINAPASPPRGRCKASSFPTTTSTTPTRRSSASPSSTRNAPPLAPSSSTPTRAALPKVQHSSKPTARHWPAIPPRHSAASSRSNRKLDAEAAKAIVEIFTEVIIAPGATDEAIAVVGAKKNLRLLLTGGLPDPARQRHHRQDRRRWTAGAVARQRGGR